MKTRKYQNVTRWVACLMMAAIVARTNGATATESPIATNHCSIVHGHVRVHAMTTPVDPTTATVETTTA